MPQIEIPNKFKFLFKPKRYKVMYGGRGGGKSHSIGRALLVMGAQRKLRIACGREIQKSIADSVHALLKDLIDRYELSAFYTVQKDGIYGANGTEIKFIGLKHNVTGIKSLEGVDICWIEEAENVSNNSWEVLLPTIRKEGSEIWVSFNTKNVIDPTYQLFVAKAGHDSHVEKIYYYDNPFFPKVLDDERRKMERDDPEAYQHIWLGEPDTRHSGAVLAKQLDRAMKEQRIGRIAYDPAHTVYTAWDLGFGDANAIWFYQYIGRELRFIDYYENNQELVEHYVKVVKAKEYNYSMHFLPHDGEHGNVRGLAVAEQFRLMGMPNRVIPRTSDLKKDIDDLRAAMSYFCFDKEKCKDGIHALQSYAYQWDEERQRFKDKPRHDWTDGAASSLRTAMRSIPALKSINNGNTGHVVNKNKGLTTITRHSKPLHINR